MSSHREAPESSKDPVADNTDVYAFVSPDRPDTVTLLANFIPFQTPEGGPNFYAFGDAVLYEIHVTHPGSSEPAISYQFRFTEHIQDPSTFLYNTGPIRSLDDPHFNRRQSYTLTRKDASGSHVLGSGLATPPCNVGLRSTPNYQAALASPAVHDLDSGIRVFAGQRAEGFYIDLGAIFDGLSIRPLQILHSGPLSPGLSVDSFQGLNVHTLALQIPKSQLTPDHTAPRDWRSPSSVIGVYASASRQTSTILDRNQPGRRLTSGPFMQVSRLANPLFNELLIPITRKDEWNASAPANDGRFVDRVAHPELGTLLPTMYPGVFTNLARYRKARTDLTATFLTGFEPGIVPNFQNVTGGPLADLMRLNMAVPPTPHPNPFGILGGDMGGFPNGRRVIDDVTSIELRAIAGAILPSFDKGYVPDVAVAVLADLDIYTNPAFLPHFPYLGTPISGTSAVPKPFAG
ncbi:DUF4331 domain-containing protein [Williamsia sterculiae]|uniref:DUF4331 domain-containing protein n=1 Tax=Williamsia sterculiae TaxID=1344003 RepID=A0A1N7CUW2_9NOCA|nr:DUF4331 domain-containing protein [Williamsia sterculiae]SIR67361.1 protein of unknown function [Williamsia sterculiae]